MCKTTIGIRLTNEHLFKLPLEDTLKGYSILRSGNYSITIRKIIGTKTYKVGLFKTKTTNEYQYTKFDNNYTGIDLAKLYPYHKEVKINYEPLYPILREICKRLGYTKLYKCWI